jgi:hypothetical protein
MAKGFESKFTGLAAGKPPMKALGLIDSLKKQAVNITKNVNGKNMTIIVKKYDKMQFQNHILGAGPVQIYQEVTVNGEMIYDYDRSVWYFNRMTISYVVDGQQKVDKVSGTILWVESADRKSTGNGEYDFDVRINEPPPGEEAIFASSSDESAFFATDNSIPSLTGTMKYHDTINGDTTTASSVKIDLTGNKLTKQQMMVLCKLLVFSAAVPMNAD